MSGDALPNPNDRRPGESRQVWRQRCRQNVKVARLAETEKAAFTKYRLSTKAKKGLPFVSAIPRFRKADQRYDQQHKAEILYKTGPRALRETLEISQPGDQFNPSLDNLIRLKKELGHVYF